VTQAREEVSASASPAALTAAARRGNRPINLYGTNPNFGTPEDLERLISTAGSQGPRWPQAPHMHTVVACLHSMTIKEHHACQEPAMHVKNLRRHPVRQAKSLMLQGCG